MLDLIETIKGLSSGLFQDSPWWLYALIALIPVSITLAIREGLCWFWKTNAQIKRLDKIARTLEKISLQLPEIEQNTRRKKKAEAPIKEEKFSLQDQEEYKLK